MGILVLLTIEKKETNYLWHSNTTFNSAYPWHSQVCIRVYLISNCLQIIHIRTYTEMLKMPTSCILKKKLDWFIPKTIKHGRIAGHTLLGIKLLYVPHAIFNDPFTCPRVRYILRKILSQSIHQFRRFVFFTGKTYIQGSIYRIFNLLS